MADERIVKLSDSNKTTDYFPVSVTEAIYHKDSKGEVEVLSDVLNDIRDDVGDASQSINDIINGNTKVKASVAESLTDEAKEEIIDEASSQAVADVGTTLETSYYTKTQIDERLQGVGKIGAATRGGAGIVRLATQEEVNSGEVTENIPEGGNPDEPPAVVVTPMTLAEKLKNYATPENVAGEVAKIVAGADKDYDTLKEIADYIASDKTNAANMNNAISANTTEITKIKDGTTTVGKASSATTAGSATTATTATNLSSAPSLGTSGNTITVTAGGKTSSAITVPYATSAGSATTADNAGVATYLYFDNPDEGKEDKIDYEGLMGKVDTKATAAAGTQWETVGKEYVDDEIAKVKNGDVVIPSASETIYGVSRLAKLEDVTSQNDSSSNDANVAVTPNTLWRYLQSIKGENNGIASLDGTGKVPPSQLPSYVDDVLEFANKASFPTTGEGSKIYIDLSTNKVYRWGGSTYVEVSSPLAIGNTTGTAYDGGLGAANATAISALQTRVGTAEGGITTINGEIAKLKTKDESHDASFQNLDSNKANQSDFETLQNKVSGIETTANTNADNLKNIIGTGIPDTDYGEGNTTQSVALAVRAIADDNGKQISTTYAKTTDIPDTSKFALKTELIDLTYEGGTEDVTY